MTLRLEADLGSPITLVPLSITTACSIVMDEPSSALDPIAEYNLNVGIDKNAKGKTVVFITHRLSTTRHVDMIYMLENGKIIESGSHDDLIRADGKYASMFNLQASKYKSESVENNN